MNSCKIPQCQCNNFEVTFELLHWLSHRGMDVRSFLQKPYIRKRKKSPSENVPNRKVMITDEPLITDSINNVNTDFLSQYIQWELPQTNDTNMENDTQLKRSQPKRIPSSSIKRK